MQLSEMIGYSAATLTTVAFLPQALLTYRERKAPGVSVGMYAVFSVGVALWLIYGILMDAWPVISANAITLIFAVFILSMKLRHG